MSLNTTIFISRNDLYLKDISLYTIYILHIHSRGARYLSILAFVALLSIY